MFELDPYGLSGIWIPDPPDDQNCGQPDEEYVPPRCTLCGAEAEEWDTACFECGGPVV